MKPKPDSGLPIPDAASAAHSERMADHLRSLIAAAGGSISFATYMQEALYAKGLGYYNAGATKFGEAGDFVTAPEISPLFGYVIGRQVSTVLEKIGGEVLEIGAGSGELAVAMLTRLADLDRLPDRYLILEVSPDLMERQRLLIAESLPQLVGRVEWVSEFPTSFCGVVVANELADAIPVERFRIQGGAVEQVRVGISDAGFVFQYANAPEYLVKAVSGIERDVGSPFPDGYESEVSVALGHWLADLAADISQGMVLLIDYGVTRREYYAEDRNSGWLRCHFRHHVHNDPLILPGIQDLTAWVDFTAVADAAVKAGLEIAGYTTQANFLMHGGLDQELVDFAALPIRKQAELSGQVKLLTLPTEMGENFKCIALGRGECGTLSAFSRADRAHML
jgi:SAM-dependent MidA family methyltransferase